MKTTALWILSLLVGISSATATAQEHPSRNGTNAAQTSKIYPVDPKSDLLMASLLKHPELLKLDEREIFESFDPARRDYPVVGFDNVKKIVSVETMSGTQIRLAQAIETAYSMQDQLDAESLKQLSEAIKNYPGYKAISALSPRELVERLDFPGSVTKKDSKERMLADVEQAAGRSNEEYEKKMIRLREVATGIKVQADFEGAWKASLMSKQDIQILIDNQKRDHTARLAGIKNGSIFPVDPKTERLMLALMQTPGLLREGDQAVVEFFNPARPDYLVARLNSDGKITKFDTLGGAQIRLGFAIANAYVVRDKLTVSTKNRLNEALQGYAAYKVLKTKTARELVETLAESSREQKDKLLAQIEKTRSGSKEELEQLMERVVLMAVASQVDRDTHGAWKAQMVLAEAKRIQAEKDKLKAQSKPASE